MEELKPNGSMVPTERGKENTETGDIYIGADGPEEVAVGQNGKRFKV
jgi:hypothetical protein